MTGYSGYSMSNNAVTAYAEGRKPLSKITAADLKAAGWNESLRFAKWLAKSGWWHSSEYHHTSKMYNEVMFYDPEILVELWTYSDPDERDQVFQKFQSKTDPKGELVEGTVLKYDKINDTCEYAKFTGRLKHGIIYFDGGGQIVADDVSVDYAPVTEEHKIKSAR